MKLFFLYLKPSTLSVALSLVFLSGCVSTKPDPEPWSVDKPLIVQSLQDVHVGSAKLEEKLGALDKRILDLERKNSEQATKIVLLEAAVLKNAKPKVIAKKAKSPKSQKSLNQRLDALSANAATKTAKPKIISQTPIQSTDEKNAYTAAYLALKSGRYDEASSGFVKVIKAHPQGEYTDQAYYWLGESLVALLRNSEALESFTVVANQYPKSAKHAAALLKIAAVYKSMKQIGKSRVALQRVIKEYPDGRTAERARAELQALPQDDGATK